MVQVRTLATVFDRVTYSHTSEIEDQYNEIRRLLEVQDERINDIIGWIERLSVPEYTTTERDALTPVVGQMIYHSTQNRFEMYQGSDWYYITNLSDATP